MRDRGIRGNDEVEALHRRRAVHEGIGSGIEIVSQALDREPPGRRRFHFDGGLILHETDQPHVFHCRERRETSKRNRPLKVDQFVALPANADSETFGADSPGPFRDETRFWMKIRDWRRNGLQAGLETAREAHERALKSKAFVRIESFDEANRLWLGVEKPVYVLAAQQG